MKLSEIENLIKPEIEKLGLILYDIEKVTENKNKILRVTIDSKKGIDISDCEKVNEIIDPLIFNDKDANEMDIEYFEVSSAGIEKNLKKQKHFKDNIGEKIQVKTFTKCDFGKTYVGILKDVTDTYIIVDDKQIEFKNISNANVVYDFTKSLEGEKNGNN